MVSGADNVSSQRIGSSREWILEFSFTDDEGVVWNCSALSKGLNLVRDFVRDRVYQELEVCINETDGPRSYYFDEFQSQPFPTDDDGNIDADAAANNLLRDLCESGRIRISGRLRISGETKKSEPEIDGGMCLDMGMEGVGFLVFERLLERLETRISFIVRDHKGECWEIRAATPDEFVEGVGDKAQWRLQRRRAFEAQARFVDAAEIYMPRIEKPPENMVWTPDYFRGHVQVFLETLNITRQGVEPEILRRRKIEL